MPERPRMNLDNPVFRGRLQQGRINTGPAVRLASRQSFGPRINLETIEAPSIPTIKMSPIAQDIPAGNTDLPKTNNVKPQLNVHPAINKQQQSTVLRRQLVQTPIRPIQPEAPRSKKKLALAGIAVIVLLASTSLGALVLKTKDNNLNQGNALGAVAANLSSAETKPTADAVSSYTVAPDLPKLITIPKLYVYGRVKTIELGSDNMLQTTDNIFDAGWLISSAKPGAPPNAGATVIDGSTNGPTQPGIFANVNQLAAGDIIRITKGDGVVVNYSVVRLENYNAESFDIAAVSVSAQPGKHGLNLITCSGTCGSSTTQATSRTIVFAVKS